MFYSLRALSIANTMRAVRNFCDKEENIVRSCHAHSAKIWSFYLFLLDLTTWHVFINETMNGLEPCSEGRLKGYLTVLQRLAKLILNAIFSREHFYCHDYQYKCYHTLYSGPLHGHTVSVPTHALSRSILSVTINHAVSIYSSSATRISCNTSKLSNMSPRRQNAKHLHKPHHLR